jgi:hypothetical protein
MSAVVKWLITPDPSLNYAFLAKVFAALSAVAVALFIAQYHFKSTSVTGFWLVVRSGRGTRAACLRARACAP